MKMNNNNLALKYYEIYINNTKDVSFDIYITVADLYMKINNNDFALKYYLLAYEKSNKNIHLIINIIDTYLHKQDFKNALYFYNVTKNNNDVDNNDINKIIHNMIIYICKNTIPQLLAKKHDDVSSDVENTCALCLTNKKQIYFYPCNHKLICLSCYSSVSDNSKCFLCRSNISTIFCDANGSELCMKCNNNANMINIPCFHNNICTSCDESINNKNNYNKCFECDEDIMYKMQVYK
jgi:tetratricopeptide (TPR) repeat protein